MITAPHYPRIGPSPAAGEARLRVALVGAGQHAREHLLPALLGLEQAQVSAIVDPRTDMRDRLADRLGVPGRCRYVGEVLKTDMADCVVAACPPGAHEDIAAECMAFQVPVFVEKPPATTSTALANLAALATPHQVVGVGMNFRWAAPILRMVELLANGRYGEVELVSVRHVAGKPRQPLWGMDLWRSFLLAQAIHPIDLITTLVGTGVARVHAASRVGPHSVSVGAQMEFVNGAIGMLVTGTQAPRFEHRIEVNTAEGVTLCLTDLTELTISGVCSTDHILCSQGWRPSPMNVGFERTGFSGELTAFLAAVVNKQPFTPSFTDLLSTYQVLDELDSGRSR